MSRAELLRSIVGLVLVISFEVGCGAPATTPGATSTPPSIPPTPTSMPMPATVAPTLIPPTATPTPITPTAAPPEPTPPPATRLPATHRIGVRVVNGVGEFYDRVTGKRFVPRGNNFVRLAWQVGFNGERFLYHSNFNVGLYDPLQAERSLRQMQAEGYNVVRVFVQGACKDECLGDPAGGLSSAYVANLADFLQRAKSHDIFVILTTDGEPGTEYYFRLLDTTWSEDFGGTNASYLRQGGILVGKQFWQDLIEELLGQEAPMDAVFAYALRNELFFETNAPPLSLSSGTVSTADGKTYDMASEEDRQRMMDKNLVLWIDQIRAAILEFDPTALVTVGFFPPDKPNPWPSAPRLIRTYPAIWESSADFIDLHPYPGGYSLDKLVENFEMEDFALKPVIMGEFGAARSTYATEAGAARALHDWQVESCKFGFDGWLLWTYDTEEQTDFYNGLTGEGLINQALMPANRPNPCEAGVFDFFEYNLALGMPAQASRSLPDQPPSGAVDGSTDRWWGAGDFATQWIQIDLGKPSTIGLIRLVITQSPAGDTLHEIWGGAAMDQLHLLHVFKGYTVDGQVLEFKPDSPVENTRFLRVVTKQSPSWVGWKEIEVLAP